MAGDGYIRVPGNDWIWCSTDRGKEINLNGEDPVRINIGVGPEIIIDKLYGPTGTDAVRVRIDMENYDWVFEQERTIADFETEWVEIARCDMQRQDNWEDEKDYSQS